MHKLAIVQRMAMLAITDVLRTMATDTPDLHAGLMPIDLVLHKMCQRAAAWMATFPKIHPLQPLFHTRARWYIKSHRLPLYELAHIYDMEPDRME